MWHELIVLLNIFGPDLTILAWNMWDFAEKIYNFCFSFFSVCLRNKKGGCFWKYFTEPALICRGNNEIQGGMLQKFESKILFISLCLFEPCCKMYLQLTSEYVPFTLLSLIYDTLLTPPQMCDKSLGAFDVRRVHNCNNQKRRTILKELLSQFSYPMVLSHIFTGNHDLVWFWAFSNTWRDHLRN